MEYLKRLLILILCKRLVRRIGEVWSTAHSSKYHCKQEVPFALEWSTRSIFSFKNVNSIIIFKIFWWLWIRCKSSFTAMTEIIVFALLLMSNFLKVSDGSTIYPLPLQVFYLICFSLWCWKQLLDWIFWNCSSIKKIICVNVTIHIFIFILWSNISVYLIFLPAIIRIIAVFIFKMVLFSNKCIGIILLFWIMTLYIFLI